jgi:hypothetical protein
MKTLKSSFVIIALACGLALEPFIVLARGAGQEGQGSVAINNSQGHVSVKLDRGSKVAISNRYGRITITGWDRDTVEAVATSDKGQEAIQVNLTADPQAHSVLSLAVVGRGGQRRIYVPGFDFQNFDFEMPPVIVGSGVGRGVGTGQSSAATKAQTEAAKQKTKEQVKEKTREVARDENGNVVVVVPMPEVVVEPHVVVTTPQATQPAQPARTRTPPAAPAPRAPVAGAPHAAESGEITLDVKIPRYAELSAIEVRYGDLSVSNIDGPVNITSGMSNINVNHVGAVEVHARSGRVTVEDVSGLAYVAASSGDIIVRRAQGDVRAVSINGDIDIECVRGRVDVSTARGGIKLVGVSGDVDATTTSSNITYAGAIRDNGSYHLKSVEGGVSMSVPDASPGFTARLSSYNGDVQTDFPVRDSNAAAPTNHRIEVRQGNGQAQVVLDSFSQPVRLVKLAAGTNAGCQ